MSGKSRRKDFPPPVAGAIAAAIAAGRGIIRGDPAWRVAMIAAIAAIVVAAVAWLVYRFTNRR